MGSQSSSWKPCCFEKTAATGVAQQGHLNGYRLDCLSCQNLRKAWLEESATGGPVGTQQYYSIQAPISGIWARALGGYTKHGEED